MTATEMKTTKNLARLAGFLYLLIIVFGIFAQLVVREGLIVPGDAAATADNILASESLYRLGFMSDLFMMTSYLLLGYTFYVLFKPVNRNLAALIVLFVMAAVPVMLLNMLNQLAALVVVDGADYLAVFDDQQLDALSLLFLNLHKYGYLIPQIFFGLWLLPIGILAYRSGYFPRILGILLVISCFAYLIGFVTAFLLPQYSAAVSEVMDIPAALPEFIFCLWLLVRGANLSQAQTVPAPSVSFAR